MKCSRERDNDDDDTKSPFDFVYAIIWVDEFSEKNSKNLFTEQDGRQVLGFCVLLTFIAQMTGVQVKLHLTVDAAS